MKISDLIIPIFIGVVILFGFINKVDVFNEFLEGAKENLKVSIEILPALIALMTCVGMFNSSGGLDVISFALKPLTSLIGFPNECIPLALLRPISGSGALTIYESILSTNSPDGFIGRVATLIMGSTETTFYTISVYFAATKFSKTGKIIIAALVADLVCFIISPIVIRLLF